MASDDFWPILTYPLTQIIVLGNILATVFCFPLTFILSFTNGNYEDWALTMSICSEIGQTICEPQNMEEDNFSQFSHYGLYNAISHLCVSTWC